MCASSEEEGDHEPSPRSKRQAATKVLPPMCIICRKKKRVTRKGRRVYEELTQTQHMTAGKYILLGIHMILFSLLSSDVNYMLSDVYILLQPINSLGYRFRLL